VALDRQSIEKKDFPIGKRGYDPDAVDAHLQRVADEAERQTAQPRAAGESLAAAASDQVRQIVEAAESTAAGIHRQSEEEARATRDEAGADARRTREEATEEARTHVAGVAEATDGMLERIKDMEDELGGLVQGLRTGADRVTADLKLLQERMGELRSATGTGTSAPASETATSPGGPAPGDEASDEEDLIAAARGAAAAEPGDAGADEEDLVAAARVEESAGGLASEDDLISAAREGGAEDREVSDPAPAPSGLSGAPGAGAGEDSEGARLVALNMALNGTPREETDQYLAENFTLSDRAGLLDEVYASVEE
jgi:DivIVA domain-containing protein